MATIRSTLSLQDNFSNTLNKISGNLNKTQSKFSSFKKSVSDGFKSSGASDLVKKIAGIGQEAERSGGIFKSVLGANLIGGAVMGGINTITSGVSGMMGELSSASKAWQTFEGNMGMLGKGEEEITHAKKLMQRYAADTIYSASDMAQTYSQLAAVGIEGTDRLVTGFGGLAAASENPTQAMKTLSQQAVQMAAKPNVAWADFKLMLEQTPAGISAVAKQMGMSTSEMVTAVQDGKIATKDFFNAISDVGTNEAFSDMATKFKTIDQAIDGLKEGVTNKVMPVFEKFNQFGIRIAESFSKVLDNVDLDPLADKLGKFLDGINVEEAVTNLVSFLQGVGQNLSAMWDGFSNTGAIQSMKSAFEEVKGAVEHVITSLGGGQSNFENFGTTVGNLADKLAKAIEQVANWIQSLKPEQIQAAAKAAGTFLKAIIGLKVARGILGGVASGASKVKKAFDFGKQVKDVATNLLKMGRFKAPQVPTVPAPPKTLPKLPDLPTKTPAPNLPSTPSVPIAPPAEPITQAGNAAGGAAAKFMQFGAGLLMVGAGVALVAGGIWILVQAAIALGKAGTPAYIALAVLVGVLFLFGAALYFAGPALTASAVGMIAFGVAVLLVGAGIMLAMAGMALLATQLPVIAQYGLQASVALLAIGVASMVLGVGALIAGVGLLVLGVGLITVGVGALIAAVGVLMLGAAVLVLGAGVIVATMGVMMLGVGAMLLAAVLPMIGMGAMMAGMGIMLLGTMAMLAMMGLTMMVIPVALLTPLLGVLGALALVTGAGFIVLGAGALAGSAGVLVLKAALSGVDSSMASISASASSAAGNMTKMVTSINVVSSGLNGIKDRAKSALDGLVSAFTSAVAPAQQSGTQIGQGLSTGIATGIQSGQGPAIASMMTLITAVQAIGMSGAGMMVSVGAMIGQGLATGMMSALGAVRAAANALVAEAERAAQAKAKIHSPSRLFRDNVGQFIGQGMAVGMLASAGAVSSAGQSLVDSALPNTGTSYAINGVASRGLGTPSVSTGGATAMSGTATESTSSSVNISFSQGAIVIQSTGDAKVDADALFKEFNRRVAEEYNRGLGYA